MSIWVILFLFVVPWLATFTGSIFGLKVRLETKSRQNLLLGFAAGVMLASSIWSLIIPAFADAGQDIKGVGVVTLGFALGIGGMLGLDKLLPHQHINEDLPEGRPSHLSRPTLLVMAVALHNIPEGLALGIVMNSAMRPGGIAPMMAIVFGIGLALQNFPEGMAVSLPMRQAGMEYKRARNLSILASFAEPASALIGFFATQLLSSLGPVVMPVMLSVAAGAMIFIVIEELIPESQAGEHGHGATYGFLAGFWIMVVMAVLGG